MDFLAEGQDKAVPNLQPSRGMETHLQARTPRQASPGDVQVGFWASGVSGLRRRSDEHSSDSSLEHRLLGWP